MKKEFSALIIMALLPWTQPAQAQQNERQTARLGEAGQHFQLTRALMIPINQIPMWARDGRTEISLLFIAGEMQFDDRGDRAKINTELHSYWSGFEFCIAKVRTFVPLEARDRTNGYIIAVTGDFDLEFIGEGSRGTLEKTNSRYTTVQPRSPESENEISSIRCVSFDPRELALGYVPVSTLTKAFGKLAIVTRR